MKLKNSNFLLALLGFLLIFYGGCKKEDALEAPIADLSGFWIVEETISGNCGSSGSESKTSIMEIEQVGNQMKIIWYPSGDVLEGTIDENSIKWEGSISSGEGESAIDFRGTVSDNGIEATGTANWQWQSNNYSCSGTSTVKCKKAQDEAVDFSGMWEGFWYSEDNNVDGSFATSVSQTEHNLSGTISIPFLNINNATLTGQVYGNIVLFGDIEGNIKFAGILEGSNGAGSYMFVPLSDEGSWEAHRVGTLQNKNLNLIGDYPIDEELSNCTGLTFDGTNFWVLSSNKVFKLGLDGTIIDAFPTPGNYPSGISYDGTNLWIGDNNFGLGKFIKIEKDNPGIIKLPDIAEMKALATGNGGMWYATESDLGCKIKKTNFNGEITNSFDLDADIIGGLCFDGKYLWVAYLKFGVSVDVNICKTDTNGNIIKYIKSPSDEVGGLEFDGKDIWYHVENLFYKIDTLGNYKKEFMVSEYPTQDFAIGGKYFWYMWTGYDNESRIYRIDSTGLFYSSFTCPGQFQTGITYDGNCLRIADRITERIYKIPVDGDYFIKYPYNDIQFLCKTSSNTYVYSTTVGNVFSINKFGIPDVGFYAPVEDAGGLSLYSNNFWFAENDGFEFKRIVKTSINGSPIDNYVPTEPIPQVYSIAVADGYIWCIAKAFQENNFHLLKFEISE